MKKGIHPKWNNEVPVIVNGKEVMVVGSTEETLNLSIWSGNHPFYTGEEMLVDTDNLVEKFEKKVKASEANSKKVTNKREKRRKLREKRSTVSQSGPTSLKDMLKQIQK